ncbi:uncharacterized protein V6R79_012888 [Siganus canaliculatus]
MITFIIRARAPEEVRRLILGRLINYILGVKWKDEYHIKLVHEDPSKSQTSSQTSSSIFGKDVEENIQILVMFADGQQPPVIEANKADNRKTERQ